MPNDDGAQAPDMPVAPEAEATTKQEAAGGQQPIDPEYLARLKREAHENRRRAKAAEEALAERERAEAEKKGDYEKLAKAAEARAQAAEQQAQEYRQRVVESHRTRAASDALLAAGITDPDLVKALTKHVSEHVEIDADSLTVSGKYVKEAQKLAEKWGKARADSPGKIVPGVPGGQTSSGKPSTPREALAADIYAKFGRG